MISFFIVFFISFSFIQSLNTTHLNSMILRKEKFVSKNCDALRTYYEESPTSQCNRFWECDYNLEQTVTDAGGEFICSKGFGDDQMCAPCNNSYARVSLDTSCIRFPGILPENINNDQSSLIFSCSNTALSIQFEENYWEDTQTTWQYIGSPGGVFITHPNRNGRYRDWNSTQCKTYKDVCKLYDPRIRPWYVAASSGPKDVLIFLDNSMSMSKFERFVRGKEAVKTVLSGIGPHDRVFVGTFSSDIQPCFQQMRYGNKTNKNLLKSCVDNFQISTEAGTNFGKAFELAFEHLSKEDLDEEICHSAILFLTDGVISDGLEGEELIQHINSKNNDVCDKRGKKTHIFTFSMGSQGDSEILQRISCENDGVWHDIKDEGDYYDLRNEMSNYYRYFVYSNRTRGVTWSEKYFDFSGLGWMTTAAKGCFSADGKTLLGVAGVDVLLTDFYDPSEGIPVDEFYDLYVNPILREKSKKCNDLEIPEETLEELRKDHKCHPDTTWQIIITVIAILLSLFICLSCVVVVSGVIVYCWLKFKDRNKFDRMLREMEEEKKNKTTFLERITTFRESIFVSNKK